jgi:hypothetical protein
MTTVKLNDSLEGHTRLRIAIILTATVYNNEKVHIKISKGNKCMR